jgi:hypothetical protein
VIPARRSGSGRKGDSRRRPWARTARRRSLADIRSSPACGLLLEFREIALIEFQGVPRALWTAAAQA